MHAGDFFSKLIFIVEHKNRKFKVYFYVPQSDRQAGRYNNKSIRPLKLQLEVLEK